jgi:C4-dicarboxylate-specific signal transduction histidine kinase
VQLQQVILNLVMNGIEATKDVTNRPRELWIRSRPHHAGTVLVSVQDTGVGLETKNLEGVFEPFYTTKAEGMGMGCRSAARSLPRMGGSCGPQRTMSAARPSNSACPRMTLMTETQSHDHALGLNT